MIYSFISIGTNIGDRIYNIKKAIDFISQKNQIIDISSLYITKPMYYLNQPYFINCAIKIKTSLSPYNLLNFILEIENKMGRKRSFKNSPRIIDLDLIYYGDLIIKSKKLFIPHPKLYERAFVLIPLSDIDKNFLDPLKNKKIGDLVKNLSFNNDEILKIPSNFKETLNFISKIPPRNANDFNTKYIKKTIKLLGTSQNDCGKVIHITGSCGKTATAFYIAKLIQRLGYNVCIYTSPHIMDIRERIIFNGKKIPKKIFYKKIIKVISVAQYLHSSFEYMTLIAIDWFSELKPDFSIIEVGMGGKNDATNIFEKSISVFTSITLEHSNWLGKNIEEIAKNKSGIIKSGSFVFISGFNEKKVIEVIKNIADAKKCVTYIFNRKNLIENSKTNSFKNINLSYAFFIVKKLLNKLPSSFIIPQLPARQKVLSYNGIKFFFDGAHTTLSMKILLEYLKKLDYRICLASFLKDKSHKDIINLILESGIFDKVILVKGTSQRTFNPYDYRGISNVKIFSNQLNALNFALSFKKNIVVTGSLYFCADILALINGKKPLHLLELAIDPQKLIAN
ncbi:MAG: 2-amino-4-hydroxy-6-hydroxymethyldihydropteridine diphosphokinase [Elusimicrobiota bacterium]